MEWYDLKGADPPPGFDPQPRLHVAIRDAATYRIDHIDVAYVLAQLHRWVETDVLGRFRPLFAP